MSKKRFVFAVLFLLITAVVIIGVSGLSHKNMSFPGNNGQLSPFSGNKPSCSKSGPITFTHFFMMPEDIQAILPLGRMIDDHITPIDHQYYIPVGASLNWQAGGKPVPLYAPADGTIFAVIEDSSPENHYQTTYGLAVSYSCSLATTFLYITNLAPELLPYKTEGKGGNEKSVAIPVKAGQILGWTNHNLDVWTIDTQKSLPGFVDPRDYDNEPWKNHSFALADYYPADIALQINNKSLRKSEPRGGRIDFDIDERLVGNWFKAGTAGKLAQLGRDYWKNELAFAYDYIDPTHVVISVADFTGRADQFGAVGNLDPATVTVESGLIKYTLVSYDYLDNGNWVGDQRSDNTLPANENLIANNKDKVIGVLLVQMIDSRHIKVETFPGQVTNQVSGFDDKVIVYER